MEFLRGIADSSADGNKVRIPPGLFQPIAADDVAADVAEVALAAPRNGVVEIAGPERAPFNEIVARYLKAVGDPREVVRDPEARYWGGRVEEHSLVPLGEARLGRIGLDEWLRRSQAQPDPAAANRGPKAGGPVGRMREGENDGRRTAGAGLTQSRSHESSSPRCSRCSARSPTCRRCGDGACMAGFVEATCIDPLTLLKTVGTHVDLSHMKRRALWHAGDDRGETRRRRGPQAALRAGVPGREGDHRHGPPRARRIDRARFQARLEKKAAG